MLLCVRTQEVHTCNYMYSIGLHGHVRQRRVRHTLYMYAQTDRQQRRYDMHDASREQ